MFSTNTIKLVYPSTLNVRNLIKQHNSSIKRSGTNTNKKDCNCRNNNSCPLDRKCLVACIVYEATVLTANQPNIYFGSADGDLKVATKTIRHSFIQIDRNTAFSCKNAFGS